MDANKSSKPIPLKRGRVIEFYQGNDFLRAVIYCRVSTKDQVQNLSLETQQKTCSEFCSRQGWAVDRVFVEQGESAKTANRTELKNLLAYCREHKGRIHCVVVYAVSRFARDKYDHSLLRLQLQRLGVTLRSATEPIDDSSTGKLMEGIVSAFAQFDNDVRSERTVQGMKARLEKGGWTLECTPKVRHGTKGPATLNGGELCWCPDNSILVN